MVETEQMTALLNSYRGEIMEHDPMAHEKRMFENPMAPSGRPDREHGERGERRERRE